MPPPPPPTPACKTMFSKGSFRSSDLHHFVSSKGVCVREREKERVRFPLPSIGIPISPISNPFLIHQILRNPKIKHQESPLKSLDFSIFLLAAEIGPPLIQAPQKPFLPQFHPRSGNPPNRLDDFGILARVFGFRHQGKSTPMSASKGPAATTSTNVGIGSVGGSRSTSSATLRSTWNLTSSGGPLLGDDDGLFGSSSHNHSRPKYSGLSRYDDVFSGLPRYSNQGHAPPLPVPTPSSAASPFDSLFPGCKESPTRASSMPVYDDDIFDGVPGMKSTAAVRFDDIFASMSNAQNDASQYADLLGNFGRVEPELKKGSRGNQSGGTEREVMGFNDLIPRFGGSSPIPNRYRSIPYRGDGGGSNTSSV